MGSNRRLGATLPSPSFAMLTGAALFGAFAVYVWLRRGSPGAKGLVLALAAGVWYMATYALELWTVGSAKQTWGDVKYVGVCLLPAAWLVFALQYTGRAPWLTKRLFFLLAVEPLVILTLLGIPSTHDLIHVYPSIATEQFPIVRFGPAGWINVFYSYGLLLFGTGILVKILFAIARPYRKQARALVAALLVPLLFNILYNFNIGPFGRVDLTPFAFVLAVVVVVWGIFRLRLLDIVPVARSRIVETMQDGVVVLDAYQRIVDLNPAAQSILGHTARQSIGLSLQQLMPDYASLLERSGNAATVQSEIRLPLGSALRDYEITLSPIPDNQGRESGKLLMLRDISERKMSEERLEQIAHYDSLTGLPNRMLFSRVTMSSTRAQASVSACGRPMERIQGRSSGMPTSQCTGRSRRAGTDSSSTQVTSAPMPPSACSSSRIFAVHSTAASCACTTSPSSRWRPARCTPSRR